MFFVGCSQEGVGEPASNRPPSYPPLLIFITIIIFVMGNLITAIEKEKDWGFINFC